jgi:hypothetical protein
MLLGSPGRLGVGSELEPFGPVVASLGEDPDVFNGDVSWTSYPSNLISCSQRSPLGPFAIVDACAGSIKPVNDALAPMPPASYAETPPVGGSPLTFLFKRDDGLIRQPNAVMFSDVPFVKESAGDLMLRLDSLFGLAGLHEVAEGNLKGIQQSRLRRIEAQVDSHGSYSSYLSREPLYH